MNELVTLRRANRTAILTLQNGPVNVSCKELVRRLGQQLELLLTDDTVGALVLTGAGHRAFMAGADVSGFPSIRALGEDEIRAYLMEDHRVFQQLAEFPKPVIAAINGLALGGGLELALMCDLRIAEEQASFGLPEITLGMFPGYGGTQRLTRLVGEALAKEMIFTGRRLDAREALQRGLINRLVPEGEALESAVSLADRIAEHSAPVLALAKRAIHQATNMPLEQGIACEAALLAKAFATQDNAEGVSAFLEKRKPVFRHC